VVGGEFGADGHSEASDSPRSRIEFTDDARAARLPIAADAALVLAVGMSRPAVRAAVAVVAPEVIR
jgi:hypothetical protein